MTLSARRLASVAGSEACYERADELVRELAGLNLGAKRIERTTRAVGADLEAWRKAALEPAAAGSPASALPERKSLKAGRVLCCALDGTGVPARPSETVGRDEAERREELERINSRLDGGCRFERHFIRGKARMRTRVGLAVCVMMSLALGAAKAGRLDRMRSLVEPAFADTG